MKKQSSRFKAHGKPAGTKNIMEGSKHKIAGAKMKAPSQSAFAERMGGLDTTGATARKKRLEQRGF